MDKIKVVIIEDEFFIAEDIRTKLEQSGYEVAGVFDSGESALLFIVKEHPDVLLVDIKLSGKTDGIELMAQVQSEMKLPFIYITANSDTVTYQKAKATNPSAFLVKPFNPANLLSAIDLALYHFSNGSSPESIERVNAHEYQDVEFLVNQNLFIRSNGKFRKLKQDDILFVEAAGSYLHIQSRQDRFTLSQNLSQFQRKTPLPNLVRIHRSYLVNVSHVDSFEESHVFVEKHKLPLGESYRADFLARIHCL
jgi:DNA-binding LytR/AlgR family response regulator